MNGVKEWLETRPDRECAKRRDSEYWSDSHFLLILLKKGADVKGWDSVFGNVLADKPDFGRKKNGRIGLRGSVRVFQLHFSEIWVSGGKWEIRVDFFSEK